MARILITSAIPYINGIKHLGNLVGSQLPADLFARFNRAMGHEVMFICATDEHGTPAELAAAKAGKPVAEYCAEMHVVQAEIAKGFRLSFDHFGRSSSARNHRLTQAFAAQLDKMGLIREVSEKPSLFHRRQTFPSRPLYRRHLPELRLHLGAGRSMRQLHQAAGPHRPDRRPFHHFGVQKPGSARDQASVPDAAQPKGKAGGMD